jgi:hypothetical protein
LFVNVTREPTATVTSFGDTPAEVIVMVAATVPVPPPPDGAVGLSLPPQDAAANVNVAAIENVQSPGAVIRRISSRC